MNTLKLTEREEAPNCWQCRFFRITHLRATPYGCNLMGFQSAVLPNLEVLRADGAPCHGFMSKPAAAQAPAR